MTAERGRVLFVTRKFPPSVGGMETLAQDVWLTLAAGGDAGQDLVAFGGSNRNLPFWIPVMYVKVLRHLLRRRVAVVLTGDAVVNALLAPLTRVFGVRRVSMVMGKDVVWDNRLYRALVLPALRSTDRVLAISSATRDAATAAGAPPARTAVVRLGVELPPAAEGSRSERRERAARLAGFPEDGVLILALGRLVKRKGVEWFARDVMPLLPATYRLVVAGDGEDRLVIEKVLADAGLGARVTLLGRVTDETRELLMSSCDLMVQPNIAVPGDMEGFGLVTVETAMRDTSVFAADLEGLQDAVIDGVTGHLLPSGDPLAWVAALSAAGSDLPATVEQGRSFGENCREAYSRDRMGEKLHEELRAGLRA